MKLTIVVTAAALVAAASAFGHDYMSADNDAWYESLRMPDSPTVSCCGGKDAYWADQTDECGPGDTVVSPFGAECVLVAIITDPRQIPGRYPFPNGTRIAVPKNKIRKVGSENPTDHTIIFLAPQTGQVYCYEPSALL